jgi:energy-coupling factor transporter transmembrane protein EcfT
MLKLHGNPREKTPMKLLRNIHRILGYVFLVYFLLMTVFMLGRIGQGTAEFSPRVIVHMVLAVMVIPLFVTKILIARFFKRLFPNLILLGLSIFILTFTLVAITGGYNLFRGTGSPSATQEGKSPVQATNNQELKVSDQFRKAVKDLIQKKCSICHDLARVKGARKNKEEWQATVDKMIKYNINANFLNETEKTLIISFLISDWKKDL